MSVIVIMAEKANAARDIAAALELEVSEAAGGFIHGNDGNDEIVIVHSQGHCLRLPEPDEIDPRYEKWNLADLPIHFSDSTLKEIDPFAAKRYGAIKAYLHRADFIINAGDAGREGELIQRWILKKSGVRKNVYRLWSSSLTKAAIRKAYNNLLGGSEEEKRMLDDLYDAGSARAIMDKFTGYNCSRLISLTKTDGVTVNYGRCKSPLTHAIIERDEEIENFVKRPYSYIRVHMDHEGSVFSGVVIDDEGKKKEFTHAEGESASTGLKGTARTISVKRLEKTANPPKPYDILTIQKKMSEAYDYEADRTLKICQSLYDTHKILSYPRTDSRYLSTDLKDTVKETLTALRFGKFDNAASGAMTHDVPARYFNDKKVTDHHALIPVIPEGGIEAAYTKLTEDERNVFDEIARSFISLFLPSCKFETAEAIFETDEAKIKAVGKKIIDPGYTVILPAREQDKENSDSSYIPEGILEGETVKIVSADVIDTETKPKKHFTTATLLDYMKIHNIGTGATRDGIIKELTERKGYNADSSVRKNGKYFVSTEFGRQMDRLIPDELKSIEYLSRIDTELKSIEDGELTKKEFLDEMEAEFIKLYKDMTANKEVLMESSSGSEIQFECPVCHEKLLDKGWGYSCRNWKKDGSGCNFSIPKKLAGKKLSDKVIGELLDTGKSKSKLKGFKSKAGNKFDAFLKCSVEDGKAKISFDFDRRK